MVDQYYYYCPLTSNISEDKKGRLYQHIPSRSAKGLLGCLHQVISWT